MREKELDDNGLFDDAAREEGPSKSALKREMTALQKLGQELMELPDGQLAQIPLSDEILESIKLYKRLKQREARRRLLQLIGKQMRREAVDQITAIIEGFGLQDQQLNQHFQRLENLRDVLIRDGDDALGNLLDEHPDLDRQLLRQLIRQAQREASDKKPPAASRKLFRYLREHMDAPKVIGLAEDAARRED